MYVCTCPDFKKRQLPCKHIFAVLGQIRSYDNNVEVQEMKELQSFSVVDSPISPKTLNENNDKNNEISKLQEVFSTITAEWKDKSAEEIRSLRTTLMKATQVERSRIAKIDIVSRINDENRALISQTSQSAPNIKFTKQILF